MADNGFVFFGSPRFAEIALRELVGQGTVPKLVVTNPDRPVGRKAILTPPEAKRYAESAGIPVAQPEDLRAFADELRKMAPDLYVVAAYARIIPASLLAIPRLGAIGIHPSLLPKYRGASPIQSAILAGETETGTTIYLLDEKMDHGPVFAQERIALTDSMEYEAAEAALSELGGRLASEVIRALGHGAPTPRPQDEAGATYTKKFRTEDAFVDPALLEEARSGAAPEAARKVVRTINAFHKEPGAWTMLEGVRTKLLRAELEDGKLRLRTIQKEGRNPVDL